MSGAAPHLVHGMGTALEAPAWPAITPDEAEMVLAHFPLAGRAAALRWHSPRPFSAAALVETERGAFFLKRHHRRVRSPAALAEEHAFIAHLRGAGLAVPQVVAAQVGSRQDGSGQEGLGHDGTGIVSQGEWTYELLRSAEGIDLYRDRQSWMPFLAAGHAREAGAALARLHLAARDFGAAPRGKHPLVASLTILPASDPLAAAEAYVSARPALAGYLADKPWRGALAQLFAAQADGLAARLAQQPSLWTHNDWHPSNLLWSADGRVSSVIDFGLATRTCALHDLATAIERTAVAWLEPRGGDFAADAQAAQALLAGYHAVLPLSRTDVETLTRLLPLVHIEFALSEADYFAGILNDCAQADMAWQDYLLGHAEWFLSAAGQAFLRAIEQGAAA
nr:phosphotransferase [uncultured Novosphingobium sp.]